MRGQENAVVHLPSLGVGLRVDAWRAKGYALVVRVSGDAGITFSDGSIYGGATFGAGIDLDYLP